MCFLEIALNELNIIQLGQDFKTLKNKLSLEGFRHQKGFEDKL